MSHLVCDKNSIYIFSLRRTILSPGIFAPISRVKKVPADLKHGELVKRCSNESAGMSMPNVLQTLQIMTARYITNISHDTLSLPIIYALRSPIHGLGFKPLKGLCEILQPMTLSLIPWKRPWLLAISRPLDLSEIFIICRNYSILCQLRM